MIFEIITLGSVIALLNILYLTNKDCIKYCEEEIKENSSIVKEAFKEVIENKENKEKIMLIIAHIEILTYSRLVKENNLEDTILNFAISINDYYDGCLNDEDFAGSYKQTLEKIYKMKASFLKYIKYIFTKKSYP